MGLGSTSDGPATTGADVVDVGASVGLRKGVGLAVVGRCVISNPSVGRVVGRPVVGSGVGSRVGDLVGDLVGAVVGALVGDLVGDLEGLPVVGTITGAIEVGDCVGLLLLPAPGNCMLTCAGRYCKTICSPSPNWPLELFPQHHRVSSCRLAQLCSFPNASDLTSPPDAST